MFFDVIKVDAIKNEYHKAEEELRQSRAKIKECDGQIASLLKAQNKVQQKRADHQLEIRKLENEVSFGVWRKRNINTVYHIDLRCGQIS